MTVKTTLANAMTTTARRSLTHASCRMRVDDGVGRPTLARMPAKALLDWLLEGDPALRWQVERDLAGAPEGVWQATRARVATEGFGARLLALQDPDGRWAAG